METDRGCDRLNAILRSVLYGEVENPHTQGIEHLIRSSSRQDCDLNLLKFNGMR